MRREIVKIGLAVVRDGHLLLVRKRGSDTFILPGGKPENGEDDLTALSREIHEELGCALNPRETSFLGTFRDMAADLPNTEVVVKLYAGTLVGDPFPQAEIEQMIWFDPRGTGSEPVAPSLSNSILPYLFLADACQTDRSVSLRQSRD
jgi:8-oxo-dGTP diphosphatase